MTLSYAAKRDANQPEIVADLRELGFDVDIVHRLKKLYDLVVTGYNRRHNCVCALRVEVKMPGEELTEDEMKYWNKQEHWEALIIAESADDVLKWFGWV